MLVMAPTSRFCYLRAPTSRCFSTLVVKDARAPHPLVAHRRRGPERLFEVSEGPLFLLIAQVRIRAHNAHRTDSHQLHHVQRQRRDDLRVTDLRKSSGSATVVSTPVREKTAEDVTAQLEAFGYRCAGTLDGWIHVPPRSEVFFRPEEVDRRSEPFDSSASLLCSLSDPQHDAGRFVPWALRRDRKL